MSAFGLIGFSGCRVGRGARQAVLCLLLPATAACTPLGATVGVGATVGLAAAEERGISGSAADAAIRLEINDKWLKHDAEMFSRVALQVHERRVLLSGTVASETMRDDAVRLAWQPEGVHEVINEINVAESPSLLDSATDRLISSSLHTQLLLDSRVSSINYSIRTTGGKVYLLGLARDRAELEAVFDIVRNTANVKKVISHVLLRDDPRRAG